MPGLVGNEQLGQDASFLTDVVEGDVTLDEWMVTNGIGMNSEPTIYTEKVVIRSRRRVRTRL